MQVGWGAGCFRRSGGSGGKGAASVVLGDLSVRRGATPPISGSRRVRRSCLHGTRRGVTLQPARHSDRHPPCTCCYKAFFCESRPMLALRAAQCFFRPLRAFPVACSSVDVVTVDKLGNRLTVSRPGSASPRFRTRHTPLCGSGVPYPHTDFCAACLFVCCAGLS